MTIPIDTAPIPLATDADGVVRVGGTRVTLDTVAAAFWEGAAAEEIVGQYPVLDLADVYSVIGFLLRRRAEVEVYLNERRRDAETVREEQERRFSMDGLRARLLARRAAS